MDFPHHNGKQATQESRRNLGRYIEASFDMQMFMGTWGRKRTL